MTMFNSSGIAAPTSLTFSNSMAFKWNQLFKLDLQSVGITAVVGCCPWMNTDNQSVEFVIQIVFKTEEDMHFYKLSGNSNYLNEVNVKMVVLGV